MEEKLLSIVLPTYNRGYMMEYTLGIITEQVERNAEQVEFIVCDNASTDDTKTVVSDFAKNHNCVRFIHYDEFVEIGKSITRSIGNAIGKYILLWGDDDIPDPYLVDIILFYIQKYNGLGVIHFNGIFGTDQDDFALKDLAVMNSNFYRTAIVEDSQVFAERHYYDIGRLSSDVFLRSVWEDGIKYDTSSHYGYEFVVPILVGAKGKECLYINYPLWLHRQPLDRSWQSKAPKFMYIGMPNILKDLEKEGIIKDWKHLWSVHLKQYTKHFYFVIPQVLLDKKSYYPLLKDLKAYQPSFIRRRYIDFCFYCVPPAFYKFLRRRRYSNHK